METGFQGDSICPGSTGYFHTGSKDRFVQEPNIPSTHAHIYYVHKNVID